jgi:RimJ/RimL family protein N-acetyltransferase
MSIKIINNLPVSRWAEYKSLRLSALKNNLDSFLYTVEETLAQPDSFWQKRLEPDSTTRTVFAEDNGQLIGMIGYDFPPQIRVQHLVELGGVFVEPTYRGQGIAQQILDEVIKICQSRQKKKIILGVGAENQTAISFYQKNAFTLVGIYQEHIQRGDHFTDEMLMEKFI